MKARRWLESRFPHGIRRHASLQPMRCFADNHFMYGATQGNDSHLTHVQQFLSSLKDYPLLYCFDHSRNSAISYTTLITPGNIKKIHWRTNSNEDVQMFRGPAESYQESFSINPLNSQSDFFRNFIHEMHIGKLSIDVIIHVTTNPYRK